MLLFIVLTTIFIILDVPLARQFLGFIYLTFIPGLLILLALGIDKVDFSKKVILAVGLSISFTIIIGLVLSFLSNVGLTEPLSTIKILISFNFIFLTLMLISYVFHKDKEFNLPNILLNNEEKIYLSIIFFLPVMALIGSNILEYGGSNSFLIIFLFFVAFFIIVLSYRLLSTSQLYPIAIFLIGFSLASIFIIRFSHISGADVNYEYFLFQTTFTNLKWELILNTPYDTSLVISILPATYQSLINVQNTEAFFKFLYVFLFSFAPVMVYLISKQYVKNNFAFLATIFFISQSYFLKTGASPRTNMAILFFGLLILTLFENNITLMKKRILLIIFLFSAILSHYTSSFIILFILISTIIITILTSKKLLINKEISVTILLLYLVTLFFWLGQITDMAFMNGAIFVKNTFLSIGHFLSVDARDTAITNKLLGGSLSTPISFIYFILTWITFLMIFIGFVGTLINYKKTVLISNFKEKKLNLLKNKFEPEYVAMAFACGVLLVLIITLPFISKGYDMGRLYLLSLLLLSAFLIIGCIYTSKFLKINPKLLIVLILIPYLLFSTDAIYQSLGYQGDYVLSSSGKNFEFAHISDSESQATKWFNLNRNDSKEINVFDNSGERILVSQGNINPKLITSSIMIDYKFKSVTGYTFINKVILNEKIARFKMGYEVNVISYLVNYKKSPQNLIYDSGSTNIYYNI